MQINGISSANITSGAVSVNAVTQYNSSASTSTTIGYTFVNTLSVRIGDLTSDKLSAVLDTSVANGGNNLTISSVDFSLSQALSIAKTLEAQQTASDDANNTAQQYAKVRFLFLIWMILSYTMPFQTPKADMSSYVTGWHTPLQIACLISLGKDP